jgi:HEAT repeats
VTDRRKLLLLLTATVICCAAALYVRETAEPTYKGRTLRKWTEQFQTNGNPYQKEEARNAIRAMTLNSLPQLVDDLNYDPPDSKKEFRHFVYRFAPRICGPILVSVLVDTREKRAAIAQIAFEALGKDASPAILSLVNLTYERNHQIANRALTVLALLGTKGLHALLEIIEDPSHPRNSWAVFHLRETRYLGTNAHPAVSLLVELALGHDPAFDHMATQELGWLGLEPNQSVPALRTVLNTRDTWRRSLAAESLGRFGAEAAEALPDLKNALRDPDPLLSRSARDAIQAIRTTQATNLGR